MKAPITDPGMFTGNITPTIVKTIWDIETGPLPMHELLQFMPTEWPMGNLKDPAKVEAAKAEKAQKWIEDAALDATTGQVLAIGLKDDAGFMVLEGEEHDILTQFWALWNDYTRVFYGFNTHGFDLMFLIRRSWKWEIDPGFKLPPRLYNLQNSIDLMDRWSCGDRQDRISLANIAKFLDLPAKTGSGADFANLYATDRAAAIEYLMLDVDLTEMVAKRMGY